MLPGLWQLFCEPRRVRIGALALPAHGGIRRRVVFSWAGPFATLLLRKPEPRAGRPWTMGLPFVIGPVLDGLRFPAILLPEKPMSKSESNSAPVFL